MPIGFQLSGFSISDFPPPGPKKFVKGVKKVYEIVMFPEGLLIASRSFTEAYD
jgi:hypothetical protein